MVKILAKYLILAFNLFLFSYSSNAMTIQKVNKGFYQTYNTCIFKSSESFKENIGISSFTQKLNPQDLRIFFHNDLIALVFENEEEDKRSRAKKYLNNNCRFITHFYRSIAYHNFVFSNQKIVHSNTNTFENTHTYITFGVFRV